MVRDVSRPVSIERLCDAYESLTRYDVLLGTIPLALFGAVVVQQLVGVPLERALFGGGIVALLALVDGLFLRPPNGFQGA